MKQPEGILYFYSYNNPRATFNEGLNGFARNFMSNENRDFVIERLERQLKEKELEVDNIKNTLHDSILREIRSDLKNDLDINNRITNIEQKINSLSNNLNGVMDELLDQKSMIRTLKETAPPIPKKETPKAPEPLVQENVEPQVYKPPQNVAPVAEPVPQAPVTETPAPPGPVYTAPVRQFVPPAPSIPANSPTSNVSVRSSQDLASGIPSRSNPANVNVNIRDVPNMPEPPAPQPPEPRSEYIIAESDEERKSNADMNSRQVPRESCNYIVAEEEQEEQEDGNRRQCESEFETVEAREDEDAVITVTRRK